MYNNKLMWVICQSPLATCMCFQYVPTVIPHKKKKKKCSNSNSVFSLKNVIVAKIFLAIIVATDETDVFAAIKIVGMK